jgi:hypothetical protein
MFSSILNWLKFCLISLASSAIQIVYIWTTLRFTRVVILTENIFIDLTIRKVTDIPQVLSIVHLTLKIYKLTAVSTSVPSILLRIFYSIQSISAYLIKWLEAINLDRSSKVCDLSLLGQLAQEETTWWKPEMQDHTWHQIRWLAQVKWLAN